MTKLRTYELYKAFLCSLAITLVCCDDFSGLSVQNPNGQSAMELMNNGKGSEGDSELDTAVTDMNLAGMFNDQDTPDQSLPELDMGEMIDLDAELPDMLMPDQEVDQEVACSETEIRREGDCGWLICQQGQWIDYMYREVCNAYDDDCDGRPDESIQSNNESSECKDEQMSYTRSICESGSCVSLPIGSCRLDGDCDDDQVCVNQNCEAVRPPLSCVSDHIIATNQSISLMSTNSFAWSSEGCNGIAGNVTTVSETELGPEFVITIDTARLSIATQVDITTNVTCNGRSIRSVIALTENCHAVPNACAYDNRGTVQEPQGVIYTSRLTTTLQQYVHTTLIVHLLNADVALCNDLENLSLRISIMDRIP